jgi:hypothetical protein
MCAGPVVTSHFPPLAAYFAPPIAAPGLSVRPV